MKKANKSDIVIKTTIRTETGSVLSYFDYSWKIELYVDAAKKFTAERQEGELRNCSIEGENILVYIDGFDWGARGAVIQETTVYFPNQHFADGNMKSQDKQTLNLVIE